MGKYAEALDRESAYERLNERMQPSAESDSGVATDGAAPSDGLDAESEQAAADGQQPQWV
ncbi:MAG: hypothetical protein WA991_02150 [Ornithinimicrobium sp.]